ncbi:MAG: Clp1/GlmU family protein [Thermodesulforhabdaceae bacterium]
MNTQIEIPDSWERLSLDGLSGLFMIIGAPDSGKSTFARYLFSRLSTYHERIAFIDGDVGQTTLGPPTTMTLAVYENRRQESSNSLPTVFTSETESSLVGANPLTNSPSPLLGTFRVFVGSTSPRGHMLQTVIGLHKLVRQAHKLRATAIVLDTTGLVAQDQGGTILKLCKIDLLEPKVVFAIRRDRELEHILIPLRRSSRTNLVELSPASAITPRDFATRRAHRREAFRRYFANASSLEIQWTKFAVVPSPAFQQGRLVALEDRRGFTLGLGIVLLIDSPQRLVSLLTPLRSADRLDTIKIGNLWLDPQTFEERRRWGIVSSQSQSQPDDNPDESKYDL